MFGIGWVKAEATVILRITTQGSNMDTTKDEWVVDVRPTTNEPFRAKVGELSQLFAKRFRFPEEHDVRWVLYNPKTHDVKWDRSDPRLFWNDDDDQSTMDELLSAPVDSKPE